ncbi:hypothetical protein, partial [[Kitasatospora] papulosa]|uniref:hypothetical protein n=1 Tax=[Kitasatospora] papulosa TaxID=1464011 RepID=UPI0036EE70F5
AITHAHPYRSARLTARTYWPLTLTKHIGAPPRAGCTQRHPQVRGVRPMCPATVVTFGTSLGTARRTLRTPAVDAAAVAA